MNWAKTSDCLPACKKKPKAKPTSMCSELVYYVTGHSGRDRRPLSLRILPLLIWANMESQNFAVDLCDLTRWLVANAYFLEKSDRT